MRGSTCEIKAADDRGHAIARTEVTDSSTRIQLSMELGQLIACASIRGYQSGRANAKRRQPTRIVAAQVKRRSPNRLMIVQDIFEELTFERSLRRYVRRRRRSRRGRLR